ncbi:MAG: 3-hydroxyacyl-CoA dehydrogenase, partial [Rhodospirillaceae bacterium]|nr:3-hydroxyacyl-CoA dehydrogenase [Rhodospirillaceae bacterium]
MSRIAVVGCGLVGTSWSLVFARAGHDVTLYDPAAGAAEAGRATLARLLPPLEASGLLNGQTAAEVLRRVVPAPDLAAALRGADHVQESAPERLDLKRELYAVLDREAPAGAVIGSSTSGLPASSFTEGLAGRSRCLVVHPINPPHLIPLVELVPAPWTDPAAVQRAELLMRQSGQTPIRLNREVNGFVVNRLQSAILAEAFRLVEDGVCGVAAVDAAVSEGLGLRWCFMGPFETIDLNAPGGIADYCRKLGPMYQALAQEQADPRPWSEALVSRIEAERRAAVGADALPGRRAWRDRM